MLGSDQREASSIQKLEQTADSSSIDFSELEQEDIVKRGLLRLDDTPCIYSTNSDCYLASDEQPTSYYATNIDLDKLTSLSVMSLDDKERANIYWKQMLIEEPEQAWNLLSYQPELLKTFSSNNIRLLFSVFSNELLYSQILEVHNLEQLPFEHQSHIIDLMFQLDAEFTSYEIINWPYGYVVRNSALLQIPESWKTKGSTGVEFMEFVYQVRDEQLNQLMVDSFFSYEFPDVKEQLEWIATYDSEGIFIKNVPELMISLSKTLPSTEFLSFVKTSPFHEEARKVIKDYTP
ncbi:hypothetical protein [Vibrio owensii]|uniref:hypothetical protein n=1 Tax=Vibrio owensii TaxID=696485 RepID=UPI00155DB912|nr:hypothetical protein [Vibrio owensii]